MPARVGNKKKYANYLKKGDNNTICDRSGFKIKASEGKYEWNGLFVSKEFWEERQPQDLIRITADRMQVDVSRPEGTDNFLTVNEVKPSDL